jgi:hypothetical protein
MKRISPTEMFTKQLCQNNLIPNLFYNKAHFSISPPALLEYVFWLTQNNQRGQDSAYLLAFNFPESHLKLKDIFRKIWHSYYSCD